MAIQFPGRYRLHVDGEVVRHLYVSSIRTLAGMDVTEEIDLTAGVPDAVVITLRPDAARITAERPKADKEEELCQP